MQLRNLLYFFSFKCTYKVLILFCLMSFLMQLNVMNTYFLLLNSDTLSTIILIGIMSLNKIRFLMSFIIGFKELKVTLQILLHLCTTLYQKCVNDNVQHRIKLISCSYRWLKL
jgi:hypothetical protein